MICFGSTTASTSQVRRRSRHQIEDASFLAFLRVTDIQLEHETIQLRLRQLVCAFLFDRVLCRKNQERIGEGISLVADCDLALLHRFEQRALNFGWRAIDFVGQNQIRKDRPELGREFAAARIVNERSDQIRGQQIGRELQPLKTGLNAPRPLFSQ